MNPLAVHNSPSRQTANFGYSNTFYTTDYGAVGDGTTDSTVAINSCISDAASFGGGIVILPPGTIVISAPIVYTADSIIIRGSGWNTIIKPVSGFNGDVFCSPLPQTLGQAGFIRQFIGLENLTIDASVMAGTVSGQGNAIHFYGTRFSYIRDVQIRSSPNWGILMDGDNTGPGNNFGYNNLIQNCTFDLCNGNIYSTNNEANEILGCKFKWCGAATVAAQPLFGTQDTNTNQIRCSSGYGYIGDTVMGKNGTYTGAAILISNSGPWRIIGNRFDQTRQQAITCNSANAVIMGNVFTNCSSFGSVEIIRLANQGITVVGNKFDATAGTIHWTYCIAEGGGPWIGNVIANNNLLAGTTGLVNLNANSTASVANNAGYNPRGNIGAPSMPATTVAYVNHFGVTCNVFITGGTVTVIAVDGVTTGLTSGMFVLGSGDTITLTYTVAPTWVWFGL